MGAAASCGAAMDNAKSAMTADDINNINDDNVNNNEMWSKQLLAEVGRDPAAVTRDFPRIHVYVSTAARNNYCGVTNPPPPHVEVVDACKSNEDTCLVVRNNLVCAAVELLLELCGEDTSTPTRLRCVWEEEEKTFGASDGSSLLLAVLLKTGMMQKNTEEEVNNSSADKSKNMKMYTEKEGKENEKDEIKNETALIDMNAEKPPSYGAADPVVFTPTRYTVHSKALRLMQYMVQGVVFYSIQWVTSELRFSWCKHMQSISWSVHVYSEREKTKKEEEEEKEKKDNSHENKEFFVIQHKQILRHYVNPSEVRNKPLFEVDWVCSVYINPQYLLRDPSKPPTVGNDGEVHHIDAEVLAARVEVPPKMLCWASRSWSRRCSELKKHLWKRFHVELDVVSALHERTMH